MDGHHLVAHRVEAMTDEAPFRIKPIGPTIGAEIQELDLAADLVPETMASLEQALIDHKVIYVRNQQDITPAQHVAIGNFFGDLEVHPFRPEGEFHEIVKLDNHKDNPVLSTDIWHADTTFRECPTKYSILRALVVPEVGGDTLWVDMQAAFDGLSDRLQHMIDGLEAVHDFKNFRQLYSSSDEDRDRLREMEKKYPNPVHPVVRTHPVSGRKAIFVNPQFTVRILGMSPLESDSILNLLYAQARIPEYQFRLHWEPGTITFWDNQSTQHYASNDYYPNRRTMERVAVIGDKPI